MSEQHEQQALLPVVDPGAMAGYTGQPSDPGRAPSTDSVALWRHHPLFGALGSARCAELARRYPATSFAPEQVIARAGESPRGVLVLLRGVAREYHHVADGRQALVKWIRAPASFGEAELQQDVAWLTSLAAVRTVAASVVPRSDFRALLDADTAIRAAYVEHLSAMACFERVGAMALLASAEQRLAAFLLTYRDIVVGGRAGSFDLPRRAICQGLGITDRGAGKMLARLRAAGLIDRDGERTELRDPEALARLAGSLRAAYGCGSGSDLAPLATPGSRTPPARLSVVAGPARCLGRDATVDDQLTIGSVDGDLLLPHESVERRHCRIFRASTGGKHWVENLGSPKSVSVNGRAIVRRAVLRDGDRVRIGACELQLDLGGVARSTRAVRSAGDPTLCISRDASKW